VTAPDAFALDAEGGERLAFGDVTILVRVSAEVSGGSFTLLEEVPPLADTPLHVHRNEDELFYVLEGEHIFRVGEEEHRVGPGGLVFAPRGVPHSQRRVVPGQGRELVLVTPGGVRGILPRARCGAGSRIARARCVRGGVGGVRRHLAVVTLQTPAQPRVA
jgi:mannose-6-phosphate isomerase-like protein (cupin superfamily)